MRSIIISLALALAPVAAAAGVDVHVGRDEASETCVTPDEWDPQRQTCAWRRDAASVSASVDGGQVASASAGSAGSAERWSSSWDGSSYRDDVWTSREEARVRVLDQEARTSWSECRGESWSSVQPGFDGGSSSQTCDLGPEGARLVQCGESSYTSRSPDSTYDTTASGCGTAVVLPVTGTGTPADALGIVVFLHAAEGETRSCTTWPEGSACDEWRAAVVGGGVTVLGRTVARDQWIDLGALP